MSNFTLRKIRHRPARKPLSEKTKQNLLTAGAILLLFFLVYWTGLKVLSALSGTRLLGFFSDLFAKELITDNQGHTNVLMLGVGGELHEGKDLTDTIIIASINRTKGTVGMLSVPRDFYVQTTLNGMRVNRLYEKAKLQWDSEQGLDFVRDTISEVLNIPIHYYAKIDFEAFEKTVDALDGVDVLVENEINDPLYPRDGSFDYEPFFLPKGMQHLDGATALKYVRSRKSSSDFDRSKRQQEVLLALKNKMKEKLFRKSVLKKLYYSLTEHVETDFSLRELLSLADFAASWNSEQLAMATLNDEPIFRGGFLYTPLRELYNGAFVLLPAGDNLDSVRHFVQLIFYGPKNISAFPLAVLNGTEESGIAATTKSIFHRFGIETAKTANARAANLLETTWYGLTSESEPIISFLQTIIPGKMKREVPIEYRIDPKFAQAKIILEIGKDAVPIIQKLDIFKNVFQLVPQAAGSSTPYSTQKTS